MSYELRLGWGELAGMNEECMGQFRNVLEL